MEGGFSSSLLPHEMIESYGIKKRLHKPCCLNSVSIKLYPWLETPWRVQCDGLKSTSYAGFFSLNMLEFCGIPVVTIGNICCIIDFNINHFELIWISTHMLPASFNLLKLEILLYWSNVMGIRIFCVIFRSEIDVNQIILLSEINVSSVLTLVETNILYGCSKQTPLLLLHRIILA